MTTKTTQTPGPWTIARESRPDGNVRIDIMAGVFQAIAVMVNASISDGDRAIVEADARLIAAAPEMLALLRHFASTYSGHPCHNPGNGCLGCEARALLARITEG